MLGIVACGAVVAVASYFVNGYVLALLGVDFTDVLALCRPSVEELLQGAGHRRADPRRIASASWSTRRSSASRSAPASRSSRTSTISIGSGRRHRDLDRARLRHGVDARRHHRDLRDDGVALRERAPSDGAWSSCCPASRSRSCCMSGFNHLLAGRGVRRSARAACCRRCSISCSSAARRRWPTGSGKGFDADADMLELDQLRPPLRFARRPIPRTAEATASRDRSSPTCCATCGSTPSSRCAPRAS